MPTRLPIRPSDRALTPRAFTIVELLVVIAVIGLLIGLLLPAVQMAREAGRQVSCANNMHQVGIGLLTYHDANGAFPQGCVQIRTLELSNGQPEYPGGLQLAWSAYLLPFIEEAGISRRLDLNKAFDSAANASAGSQVIQAYLCPSHARTSYLSSGLAVTDYCGIYGEPINSTNNPPNGCMIFDKPIRIADITDGTSCTMMVAENSQSTTAQWINGDNVFDVACAVNTGPVLDPDIHSLHPGGANGLFADGSVHFLADALDLSVLAAIVTRAGGETVSIP